MNCNTFSSYLILFFAFIQIILFLGTKNNIYLFPCAKSPKEEVIISDSLYWIVYIILFILLLVFISSSFYALNHKNKMKFSSNRELFFFEKLILSIYFISQLIFSIFNFAIFFAVTLIIAAFGQVSILLYSLLHFFFVILLFMALFCVFMKKK